MTPEHNPATKTERRPNQHGQSSVDLLRLAIEFVALLGLFYYACKAGVQATANQQAAEASAASTAAWLVVKDRYAVVGADPIGPDFPGGKECAGSPAAVVGRLGIENVGQTPAIAGTNTWKTAFVRGTSEAQRPTLGGCPTRHRTNPGVAAKDYGWNVFMWHCLSEDEYAKIKASEGRVYFHLCTTYKDVFGRERLTEHALMFPTFGDKPESGKWADWSPHCNLK